MLPFRMKKHKPSQFVEKTYLALGIPLFFFLFIISVPLHATNRLQIQWTSGDAVLKTINGDPLAPGLTDVNGDGAIIELGYFTQATPSNLFSGEWVSLTHGTTIGDSSTLNDIAPGSFQFSSLFEVGSDTVRIFPDWPGEFLAVANTPIEQNNPAFGRLLAMRFYNTSTVIGGARYNTMSHPSWLWSNPGNPVPFPIIFEVQADDSQLEFQDSGNVFLASIVANPEVENASIYTVSGEVIGSGSIQGLGLYEEGALSSITAEPSNGYEFVGWSGDLSGVEVQRNLVITEPLNFTATFQPINYSVSADVSPSFTGIVTGAGSFEFGSVVSISAIPSLGYRFLYWKGLSGNIAENPLSLTIRNDVELQAVFEETFFSVTTLQNLDAGGVVSGGGIFSYGELASIIAEPAEGYFFVGWLGTGIANPQASATHLTVSSDIIVTGVFEKNIKDNYLVTLSVQPDNAGNVYGDGEHLYDASVVLSAEPAPGYFFVKWVDDEGTAFYEQSFNVTLQENLSYKAVFEKQSYKVQLFGNQEQESEAPKGSGNYSLGDSVTLVASPLDGFDFSEWSVGGYIDYSVLVGTRMDGLGSGFFIDIRDRPELRFVRGVTYRFFLDGISTSSHPFFFSTSAKQENPDLFAGEYTLGVTNSRGVVGAVEIIVDESTPDSLYYYSGSQSGVGGNITVIDPGDIFSESNANPANLTVIGDLAIQALYHPKPVTHTLFLETEPANGGSVTGSGSYVDGSHTQIKALPSLGYYFAGWEGESVNSSSVEQTIVIQSDLSLKAFFATNQITQFIDEEWRLSLWLGFYQKHLSNWVFSLAHGWIYPVGNNDSSIHFASALDEWFWTSDLVYPNIYSHERESWLYYSARHSTMQDAFFYDHGSKRWLKFGFGSMSVSQ